MYAGIYSSNVCTCDQMNCLECDLDKISAWSYKWQMLFNADKCEWLRVGQLA